jgi:hypothetical protein
MKTLTLILLLPLFAFSALAQEADTNTQPPKTPGTELTNPPTPPDAVLSGDDQLVEVKNAKDTTRIKIGKKTISIIEDPTGTSVKVSDVTEPVVVESADEMEEDMEEAGDDEEKESGKSKMEGHWSGFYWGINNFLNSEYKMALPAGGEFMDLNTGRSWNFNINMFEKSFGFGTDRIGLVTGLGFGFNNYHFDRNNNVMDSAGSTYEKYYGDKLDKSKLSSTYLNVPLLLEFQFPNADKDDRAYISVGVIGGVKIGSRTKVEYRGQKDKVKGDFNLAPIRYAFTARVGYKDLGVYANYYPVQLFKSGNSPELYPFDLGLAFTF